VTTTITLTGTGVPIPTRDRAGAGVLIAWEGEGDDAVRIQVDAGRGTTMRLTDLGVGVHQIDALLLTHLHSDHVADLADLVLTRWVEDHLWQTGPLPVVAPDGRAPKFVSGLLDAYAYDIEVRRDHVQDRGPEVEGHWFEASTVAAPVWRSRCGRVEVAAVSVRHEPVEEAVGYRITTPDGVVVVSGDTRVCPEVERLAEGADVLVHEACRATALADAVRGTAFETIFSYHADTVALGEQAAVLGVPHLVLTHLIPAPEDEAQEADFESDVRRGGYTGTVSVGRDLMTVTLG
jgi:ribonuclease Z